MMKYAYSIVAVGLIVVVGVLFFGGATSDSSEGTTGARAEVEQVPVTSIVEQPEALKPEPSSSEFMLAEGERLNPKMANQCIHNETTEGSELKQLVTVTSTVAAGESLQYRYEVANHFGSPLTAVKFGEDSHFHFFNLPGRFPESIAAPPEWVGESVAIHESEYFRIVWVTEAGINQGMSEAGFALTFADNFPVQEEKNGNLFSSDGNPIEKMDMSTPPFTAVFQDGSCFWGAVKAH